MRTSAICPTCSHYTNALCIIYNGIYLANLDINPLDDLETILGKINDNFIPLNGEGPPPSTPTFIGQFYVDTLNNVVYMSYGISAGEWNIIATTPYTTSTTTTSTTAVPTTTTTTTAP